MVFTRVKDGKKPCTLCKRLLPVENFAPSKDINKNKTTGKTEIRYYCSSKCRECARKVTREWMYAHKEYSFHKTRQWREELKSIVYEHYGGKCVCCGESNYMFLTIDHINNDGYKGRLRPEPGSIRKRRIAGDWYKYIIDSNFPGDLQLLCYNCNGGKQRNFGTCPHIEIIEPYYGSHIK